MGKFISTKFRIIMFREIAFSQHTLKITKDDYDSWFVENSNSDEYDLKNRIKVTDIVMNCEMPCTKFDPYNDNLEDTCYSDSSLELIMYFTNKFQRKRNDGSITPISADVLDDYIYKYGSISDINALNKYRYGTILDMNIHDPRLYKNTSSMNTHDIHSNKNTSSMNTHDIHSNKNASSMNMQDAHSNKNASSMNTYDPRLYKNTFGSSSSGEHSNKNTFGSSSSSEIVPNNYIYVNISVSDMNKLIAEELKLPTYYEMIKRHIKFFEKRAPEHKTCVLLNSENIYACCSHIWAVCRLYLIFVFKHRLEFREMLSDKQKIYNFFKSLLDEEYRLFPKTELYDTFSEMITFCYYEFFFGYTDVGMYLLLSILLVSGSDIFGSIADMLLPFRGIKDWLNVSLFMYNSIQVDNIFSFIKFDGALDMTLKGNMLKVASFTNFINRSLKILNPAAVLTEEPHHNATMLLWKDTSNTYGMWYCNNMLMANSCLTLSASSTKELASKFIKFIKNTYVVYLSGKVSKNTMYDEWDDDIHHHALTVQHHHLIESFHSNDNTLPIIIIIILSIVIAYIILKQICNRKRNNSLEYTYVLNGI